MRDDVIVALIGSGRIRVYAAGRLLDGREWNECPKAGAS